MPAPIMESAAPLKPSTTLQLGVLRDYAQSSWHSGPDRTEMRIMKSPVVLFRIVNGQACRSLFCRLPSGRELHSMLITASMVPSVPIFEYRNVVTPRCPIIHGILIIFKHAAPVSENTSIVNDRCCRRKPLNWAFRSHHHVNASADAPSITASHRWSNQ